MAPETYAGCRTSYYKDAWGVGGTEKHLRPAPPHGLKVGRTRCLRLITAAADALKGERGLSAAQILTAVTEGKLETGRGVTNAIVGRDKKRHCPRPPRGRRVNTGDFRSSTPGIRFPVPVKRTSGVPERKERTGKGAGRRRVDSRGMTRRGGEQSSPRSASRRGSREEGKERP